MDVLAVNDHSTVLLQFLYKLYQDQALCDFQIVALDGTPFWVHKVVMMASSKYIHNVCLEAPDLQKLQFSLHADMLHILIEFCYTGQLFVSSDNCQNVQDGAILLQMTAAVGVLSQQMLPGTSSLLPSVDKLVTSNVYTGLREQSLSINSISTYNDISSLKYSMADPCGSNQTVLLDDAQSYHAVTVKLEDGSETVPSPTKLVSGNLHSAKSLTKCHGNQAESSFQGHSKVSSDGQTSYSHILESDESSRSQNERLQTHVKGHGVNRSCIDRWHSSDESTSIVNLSSANDLQENKIVNMITSENVADSGNERKILLKIKCLKTRKNVTKVKKSKVTMETKIFVPKILNRFCFQCKKSYSSVVQLHYHKTHSHPLEICGYLRRKFALQQCKKYLLLWKRVKNSGNLKQFHVFKGRRIKLNKYNHLLYQRLNKCRTSSKVGDSWLRFCSLRLELQKLIVPLAKDRKNRQDFDDEESSKKAFHCVECDRRFFSSKALSVHQKKVHQSGKVSKRQQNNKMISDEALFACTKCQQPFSSQPALNIHLQKIHKYSKKEANELQHFCPELIKCEVQRCGFITKNLHAMRDHVHECHPYIKYACTQCSMTFKVHLMLKRHVFSCHTTGKLNFHCQLCDKSFRKGSMLRKHEYFKHKIHHDNIKVYRCEHPGCKYETYASTAIKIHQSKHNKEKLFTCEYCGMKLKTEKIHRKHVDKMHLGIRPFLCQVCGLNFGEKHELQSHITNRHSNERTYQCKHCPYSTSVKATFYTHLFNVHKERAEDDKRELYSCPHCPFTSILRYRYQTHVNGHTNTRNYECKICAKSFVSANTLRSHNQWVHSDKVYSCTQCEYQTKTTQKLNEHIRVQHQLQGFKPYKCPYCTFRCATGGNTRKHVKQVHKGQEVTYIRDDELLRAARDARATGHYASLFNTLTAVNFSHEASEDERSELSENILHIAV